MKLPRRPGVGGGAGGQNCSLFLPKGILLSFAFFPSIIISAYSLCI